MCYGPRLGIVRDEADDTSRGGIIIPDEAKAKPIRGRVILIGLGVDEKDQDSPCYGLRLGDHVTFSKYNGIMFDVDPADGGEPIDIEAFHASDLYLGIGSS